MKIFAISDLHLCSKDTKPMDIFGGVWEGYFEKIIEDANSKVNDEDIVLIAGDISWAMGLDDAKNDLEKLSLFKGKKVIIKGNHDYWWSSYSKVKKILPNNVYAIQNNSLKFNNIIICGTRGWGEVESGEDRKIYDRELIRMRMSLDDASKKRESPDDKLIALIHYPPFNAKYEESDFTKLFEEFSVNAVVYGHLHGNKSQTQVELNRGNIPYYLTSCDILSNQLLEINF